MKPVPAALIDEGRCIGCTLCIDACPVDAIVGARGFMHTVVEPWCIGCGLCVAPCPVDCIDMVPREGVWTAALRRAAGARGRRRRERLEKRAIRPAPRDRRAVLKKVLGR
ncbi:MAG TPA: RnfABCDGE type electron transport complex subunit B [Burkholderiales bacterium]|nr:RnfABCDGE type electron transport complex subunit B [Burkholderiales bacterium]